MSDRFDMYRKDKALWNRVKRWPRWLRLALLDVMELAMNDARNHVYRVGFSGGPDHLTSRRHEAGLRGSIAKLVHARNWPKIIGGLFSNVVYARIHEFGGTTRPHVIAPKRANVLAFQKGGQQVFARRVHHPGSKIPARPYIRPAVEFAARNIDPHLAWAMRRHFKGAAT